MDMLGSSGSKHGRLYYVWKGPVSNTKMVLLHLLWGAGGKKRAKREWGKAGVCEPTDLIRAHAAATVFFALQNRGMYNSASMSKNNKG